jgi:4-hydroxy-tetrahydrodipicolinate synthase
MKLGPIATAMVTPFDERGALDTAEAARLARWLVDRGNDALVIAGSTGEGQTLDDVERYEIVKAVKDAVGQRATVIANVGTNATRETIVAAHRAEEAGADALLIVVPYYNKPTQTGMLRHFGAVADAVALPQIVYNVPSRTAANMLPETLLELVHDRPNVIGVKESSGDLRQIATIVRNRPNGFQVLAGDDPLFLPCLAIGADGVVGVASHLCSREFRQMYDAFSEGRVREAAATHASLLPLFDALFRVTNPIPVKWAMSQLGFRVGRCRSPLDDLPDSVASELRPVVADFADPDMTAVLA